MPKSFIKATAARADTPAVIWHRWQTQAVRDLAWCCLGQDLMIELPDTSARPYRLPPCPELLDWLDELDNNPEALLAYLSTLKSTRLGIYFEALWRFFWQWHRDVEILAYNKQVQHKDQTLGAFDFLLQQKSDLESPFVHVECAVKFYLGTGDKQWHHWVGPSANDRLDNKLKRLLEHQLPLAQHPAVRSLEITPGVTAGQFTQAYVLRGYFFSHLKSDLLLPEYANPLLPESRWCYCRELADYMDARRYHYELLTRQQWLSPASKLAGHSSISAEQIQHAVKESRRAVFVAVYAQSETVVTELQRVCVAPDHWPATATPPRNI